MKSPAFAKGELQTRLKEQEDAQVEADRRWKRKKGNWKGWVTRWDGLLTVGRRRDLGKNTWRGVRWSWEEEVLGKGKTWKEAFEDADRNLARELKAQLRARRRDGRT